MDSKSWNWRSYCGHVPKDTEHGLMTEVCIQVLFLGHGAVGIGQLDVCFRWMILLVGNEVMGERTVCLFPGPYSRSVFMELLARADLR